MDVIPDEMPWRLYIDMDEHDSKREGEDFGLILILEYGTAKHILLDSDSVRLKEFYAAVGLEDVQELFESIIYEVCKDLTDSNCKRLCLNGIVEEQTMEWETVWRDKYNLPRKE